MSIFDGLLKSRDELKKEMTEADWWAMDVRRLDVAITELLFQMQSDVEIMLENGWLVPDVPSMALLKSEEAKEVLEKEEEERPADLPGRGKQYPEVAFVGASMSETDKIRNRHLSGMVGLTFKEMYVEPLGLSMDDVYVTTIVKDVVTDEEGKAIDPDEETVLKHWDAFVEEMNEVQPRFVVALGKTAAHWCQHVMKEWVPHPRAIRLMGDSGEVARKMARLEKSISEPDSTMSGTIIKSEDEKQIVYGVVMEPMENDTDQNWTTEDQIADAAHYFMKNFRLIDTAHTRVDIDAVPVESWVTHEDTTINGQAVKAGSWVMGVKVEDAGEWEKVKSGDYQGFSIDAFARIAPTLELP